VHRPSGIPLAPGGADRDQAIRTAFQEGDLQKALLLLNATVVHRYTAVYFLVGADLVNTALIDKQRQPPPDFVMRIAMKDSFCQFVFRDGHFQTNDSAVDGRLEGHVLRGRIASYGAAPVTDLSGKTIVGSVCHFDMEPQKLTVLGSKTLQWVGRVLSRMNFQRPPGG
jgi:hypothetical protein